MLKARPTALTQATERMAPKKAPLRKVKAGVTAFRAQLLSKPVDALTRVRLRPKALEALPLLATERRNPELRARVLALTLQYAKELRWPTLGRLLPWVLDEPAVRKVVFERCSTHSPQSPSPGGAAPAWIQRYWRAALAKNHHVSRTLDAALKDQPHLARLLADMGLKGASPFAKELLDQAVARHKPAELLAQPWTETLRFIERSSAPWSGRRALLKGILQALPPAPEHLNSHPGWLELCELAVQKLGHPNARVGAWKELPPETRRLVSHAHRAASPLRAFPQGDPRAWTWVALGAHQAERVGPAVLLHVHHWVCAERAGGPAAVRVWASSDAEAVQRGLAEGKKASELPAVHARLEREEAVQDTLQALLTP